MFTPAKTNMAMNNHPFEYRRYIFKWWFCPLDIVFVFGGCTVYIYIHGGCFTQPIVSWSPFCSIRLVLVALVTAPHSPDLHRSHLYTPVADLLNVSKCCHLRNVLPWRSLRARPTHYIYVVHLEGVHSYVSSSWQNGQSFQNTGYVLSPSWNHWNSHFFKWVFLIRHTLWWYHESWDNKCCASYGHLWSNASEGLWFFKVEIPIERKYVTGHRANTRQKKNYFPLLHISGVSLPPIKTVAIDKCSSNESEIQSQNLKLHTFICIYNIYIYMYIYMALGSCKMSPSWF